MFLYVAVGENSLEYVMTHEYLTIDMDDFYGPDPTTAPINPAPHPSGPQNPMH